MAHFADPPRRLTEVGEGQASALRPELERPANAVSVVLVSCLSRAIKTALLAFPGDGTTPPFEVVDNLRERIGTHPCDKRRAKADIAADFPTVSLDDLTFEEDERWSEEREPVRELIERSNRFLTTVRARPEHRIGVCSHNDFLTAVFFDSVLRFDDEALRVKFANAQHHAIVLRWEAPEEGTEGARAADTPKSVGAAARGASE